MKNFLPFIILILFLNPFTDVLNGQIPADYFQQEVNTIIKVKLDDKQHRLSGQIFIDYLNNSNIDLDTIYIHLWANAYKDKTSAFSKQMLQNKDTGFYFADEDQMGGYDSLNFRVDGKVIFWEYHPKHKDIAYIVLEKTLKQGESLQISTAFNLKIPGAFSRLGHVGQSYQITQWFPKPAVYDKNGWNIMPYLNMGEFYSEFGNYDVTLTLPENYFVAATGELVTQSEIVRIRERDDYTRKYLDTTSLKSNYLTPPSSSNWKSIRFIAENVHDFAWFADKRFLVREGEVTMTSGKKVKTQSFFLHNRKKLWQNSLKFVERGLKFYSKNVGEYPYPKVAAIQGELRAGGGMEYPMVTVISDLSNDKSLDHVIIHEVGHNWFYGILGFNERRYPWLDEGINSYFDHQYEKNYYQKKEITKNLPKFASSLDNSNLLSLYHQMANKNAFSQASSLASDEYSMYNYFIAAYENPAIALEYLASYLGQENFTQILKDFYSIWKFKHPGSDDLFKHFNESTDMDISWFFNGMIGDTRVFDYAFKSCYKMDEGYEVSIKNHTYYPIPFQLKAYQNDVVVVDRWIEGFTGEEKFYIDVPCDYLEIDPDHLYTDNNRHNNMIKTKGLMKKMEKVDLAFFDIVDDPKSTQIAWLPSVGWNKSDGLMIGAMFFNASIPSKSFQYTLHPTLSFKSPGITGQGLISYNWSRNRSLRKIKLSLGARSFHYEINEANPLRYIRLSPKLELTFNKDLTNKKSYNLSLTTHLIKQERTPFEGHEKEHLQSLISKLTLKHSNNNILVPIKWQLQMENAFAENPFDELDKYLKISGELNTSYLYSKKKKIAIRFYGGSFLYHSNGNSTLNKMGTLGLIGNAMNDYTFEDYFFDRGAQEGFLNNQINLSGGGFKNAIGSKYNFGQSNKYLLSANLYSDLPFDIPFLNLFKVYFDAGMYAYLPTINDGYRNTFQYSGGIMIASFENLLNIYIPILQSKDIKDIYQLQDNFFQRISFSMNLKLLDFNKLLDRDDLLYLQ